MHTILRIAGASPRRSRIREPISTPRVEFAIGYSEYTQYSELPGIAGPAILVESAQTKTTGRAKAESGELSQEEVWENAAELGVRGAVHQGAMDKVMNCRSATASVPTCQDPGGNNTFVPAPSKC